MDAIDAIFKRRSVRKYVSKKIEDSKIDTILKSAMYAPSANNERPWHLITVKDRKKLNELSESLKYGKMLSEAELGIVVCADPSLSRSDAEFWAQDCSAATQNILISATAFEIGSVWIGIYPHEERMTTLRRLLDIPNRIIPFNVISLGYPDGDPFVEKTERYLPERVHSEKW